MSASWFVRTAAIRSRTQAKLLVIVTAVAVLACTLITTLGILVTVTERSAVRGALIDKTAEQVESRLWITRPEVPLDDVVKQTSFALNKTLTGATGAKATAFTLSELGTVVRPEPRYALSYLGELENIKDRVTLIDGDWPEPNSSGPIEVVIPSSGLKPLHVKLGGELAFSPRDSEEVQLVIVGVFTTNERDASYWDPDVLKGESLDKLFPVPGAGGLKTDAVGPLLVAPGAMNANEVPIERVVMRQVPDLDGIGVEQLIPLVQRLNTASEEVPTLVGAIADNVSFSTGLQTVLNAVTTSLSVTRSSVVVLGLLLLTVAIVALTHTARLLNESREGERNLMRARGSSEKHLVALSVIEAGLIAFIAAAASPFLARLIFQLVSNTEAMRAGGMAVDPGLPPVALVVAPAIALVFGIVLILPMLKRSDTFHEGEQARSRPKRASDLQRSGIDFALLGIAAVVYWQLVTYRSPVGEAASLSVDPVLVLGPTLILLAGGLLGVRLVPAASRLFELIAARSRGIVPALAAWEVGRRAQRVTAAVLLLTIALAVGAFSQTFLATWKQSQLDQAGFAVGAPLRVYADKAETASKFARDEGLRLQPVMRRPGVIAAKDSMISGAGEPQGENATVLGLTGEARDLLNRGRVGASGGKKIDKFLTGDPLDIERAIELPGVVDGFGADVRIRSDKPLETVQVMMKAIVQDESGSLSNVDLGLVPMDDKNHRLRVELPKATEARVGVSLVGIQAFLFDDSPAGSVEAVESGLQIMVRDIHTLTRDGKKFEATEATVPEELEWFATGDTPEVRLAGMYQIDVDGYDLAMYTTSPLFLRGNPSTVTLMNWEPVLSATAVVGGTLGEAINADEISDFTLVLDGYTVPIFLRGETAFIPGGGSSTSFDALTLGEAAIASTSATIVVDQNELMRLLMQIGFQGELVDEWWADADAPVATTDGPLGTDGKPLVRTLHGSQLGVELQEHPLRAAVQGASILVLLGAGILAAVGFAVHATGSLRSRSLEFAQLRAVGLSRLRLIGVVAVENALLSLFGTLVGVALGVLIGYMVSPLVGASADGSDPVPPVDVFVPWAEIGVLALAVASVLVIVVFIAAASQRTAAPATLLRSGSDR